MQPLLNQFKTYLEGSKSVSSPNQPLSPSSIKNYVSDINHFFTWLSQKLNHSAGSKPLSQPSPSPISINQSTQSNQSVPPQQPTQPQQSTQPSQPVQAKQPITPASTKPSLSSSPSSPAAASITHSSPTSQSPSQTNPQSNKSSASPNHPTVTTNHPPITILPLHITPQICQDYQEFLAAAPPSTANRRLSSLRRLTAFLAAAKLLPIDPGQQLKNLTSTTFDSILDQFQTFLKSENLSPSTIKNYLSDVKNYLLWTQTNIKTTDGDLAQRPLS